MAMALVSAIMGGGKDDKDKVADTSVNVEIEQVQAMDNLTAQVEQATLDAVKKNAHCALAEVMEGWKIKGQIGDNCPRSLMGTPCAVAEHTPVDGKGYFVLPGRLPCSNHE